MRLKLSHNQKLRLRAGLLTFCFAVVIGAAFSALRLARVEHLLFQQFQENVRNVPVIPPERSPVPSQHDIDLAVELYSIETGPHIDGPYFDPELQDRGLTTGSTLPGPRSVLIGPAAFTSWAVLGSTLGHEIEVHGKQSFLGIVMQDEFSRIVSGISLGDFAFAGAALGDTDSGRVTYGTWRAERDAYEFELKNAKRFGLSSEEVRLIQEVMESFYPQR